MPADTKHADYADNIADWELCRDFYKGERVVKGKAETYLPRLSGHKLPQQGVDPYQTYLDYASFYGAFGRTVDALTGMAFRKAPTLDIPAGMEEFAQDVTGEGLSLRGFAEELVDALVTVGRDGILIDYPQETDARAKSRRQAEQSGRRPYWQLYQAEDILDWAPNRVDSSVVVRKIALRERFTEQDPGDEFRFETGERIRILDLDGEGRYRQRVFSRVKSNWVLKEEVIPLMNGSPLNRIPFVFSGPKNTTPRVDKPPLLDLAYKNWAHYRKSAAYEYGLLFTGQPTPLFIGWPEMKESSIITLGVSGLHTEKTESKADMLEFSGQGLEAIRNALRDDEQAMALLGARTISPEKRMVEAAETAMIHRMGEVAVLASLVHAASDALREALTITRDWYGINDEESIAYAVNDDFISAPLDFAELVEMMKLVQGGYYSRRDLHRELQRAERMPSDRSVEDVMADRREDITEHGDGPRLSPEDLNMLIEMKLRGAEVGDPPPLTWAEILKQLKLHGKISQDYDIDAAVRGELDLLTGLPAVVE